MNKNIIGLILVGLAAGFGGFFLGFSLPTEEMGINIHSIEDGQVVHSKIVIDASFSGRLDSVEVQINGKKMATYLPYIWNNIQEPAGEYRIKVIGRQSGKADLTDEKKVVIAEYEEYTPANFTCKEDIVIHKGQTVVWRDGIFNCGQENINNGPDIFDKAPSYINIYGNLTIINARLERFSGVSVKEGNFIIINCQVEWIRYYEPIVYVVKNSYMLVDGSSQLTCRKDSSSVIELKNGGSALIGTL